MGKSGKTKKKPSTPTNGAAKTPPLTKVVKEEIASVKAHSRTEQLAFLAGVIRGCGSLNVFGGGKGRGLTLSGLSDSAAAAVCALASDIFGLGNQSGGGELSFSGAGLDRMLQSCGIFVRDDSGEQHFSVTLPTELVKSEACAAAVIRGTFLGCGSLAVSDKYHLEFAVTYGEQCEELKGLLERFGVRSGEVLHRDKWVLYVKDSGCISDCLVLMGAHKSVLALNNIIAERQLKSYYNRANNCELHNMDKTIDAAVRCGAAIKKLMSEGRITDDKLLATAKVRLQHPDYTYDELSELLGISKSGVKHRLARLTAMAEENNENGGREK